MKVAAFVALVGGGEADSLGSTQVCLNGDGIAGAVGWGRPVVRKRGTAVPLIFRATGVPLIIGFAPFTVGKANARLASGCDAGGTTTDRFSEVEVAGGVCEVDDEPNSPLVRLRLLSRCETSGVDSFNLGVIGRDGPNAGDRYRLRGRALPAPSHR
jgi:hypothetical protein